ncbi:MAG: DNA primase [Thermoleophilia bacterium]|nr:DNA primase [Thermoleophilia bacterium]
MALITQASIQAVLDACDMLEIVAPYTTLKKSGTSHMGRCPFHGEKTPSFSVDPVRKLYYCFGCGEGGNAFRFIQEKEGLQFVDAVRSLADKYGVSLDYESSSPEEEKRRVGKERIYSLLDQAAGYYSRVLQESSSAAAARDYLSRRGFKEEVISDFRLGFSPEKGKALLKAATAKGYAIEELVRAGLLSDRRGGGKMDRFRGRLMFPFTDHRGRVLGFGARVLDESKPKYMNSPETELYHKSRLVFGLGNARRAITRENRVFVVEGYTDVLALNQAGMPAAVASMGTALTEQQMREISRFTKNVFLAFDADWAGRSAMLRALEPARRLGLNVRVIEMPTGNDPADLVFATGGLEQFGELAASAPGLLKYQVQTALSLSDLDSTEGKVQAFKKLGPILSQAPNSIERDEQIRIVAGRLRLSPENMAYLMQSAPSTENGDAGGSTKRRVLSQGEITERSFLSLCLAREEEAGRYLQLMTEAHFTTDLNRSAFNWVKNRLASVKETGSVIKETALPAGGELSDLISELFIRAQTEKYSPAALPELFMRLCESEIYRRIEKLKSRLGSGEEVDLKELYRLEDRRRGILRKIQSGTFETV